MLTVSRRGRERRGEGEREEGLGGYLLTDGPGHCHREGSHISATQILPLALAAEELELALLFVVQGVAVARLG